MPKNSLEQFFDDLLSEPGAGTAMARRRARAALLAAMPQNADSAAIADIAAHLDTAPDSGGDGIFLTKMARDSDAIYELESAQTYLNRMTGEQQPVPAALSRLAGASPAIHAVALLPEMHLRSFSLRRNPILIWGGAVAAVLLAGITGYTVHDLIDRGHASLASAAQPLVIVKKPVVRSQTVPSQAPMRPATPPTYTTANVPIPLTPHAVGVDDYPPESVQSQEQGTVKVKYLVLNDGTVGNCEVEISSSFPRLDQAACILVRRWLFKPATVMGGSPIGYWLDASIAFQLK